MSAIASEGGRGCSLGEDLIGAVDDAQILEVVDDSNNAHLDLDTFPEALLVPPLARSGEPPGDVGFLRGGISEGVGDKAIYWECAYVAGGADTMNSDDSDRWNVALI